MTLLHCRPTQRTYERRVEEAKKNDGILNQLSKCFDQLQKLIYDTFHASGCSEKSLEEELGLNTEMSPSSILAYFGMIEERGKELLNTLHYIKLKVIYIYIYIYVYIFYFNLSFVPILVYIYLNRKPITVYQSSYYLHLLIHGNCLYELAAHVQATPLRCALNSHPVNIINVFLCFV